MTTSKRFEDVYPTLPGTGWLSEVEARLLWDSVNRTEGPILEVGCYHGRSSVLLASTGRPLYCVDPFEGFNSDDPDGRITERAWAQNIYSKRCGPIYPVPLDDPTSAMSEALNFRLPSVYLFRQRVEDWEVKPVSFAYLDGDHTYSGTVNQIEKAKLCNPKVVAVHDVNDSGGGVEVKRACLELLGQWETRVERLAVWTL